MVPVHFSSSKANSISVNSRLRARSFPTFGCAVTLYEVFKLRFQLIYYCSSFFKASTSLLHFKLLCVGEVFLRGNVGLHRGCRCGYEEVAGCTVEHFHLCHVVVYLQSLKSTILYGSATLAAFIQHDVLQESYRKIIVIIILLNVLQCAPVASAVQVIL